MMYQCGRCGLTRASGQEIGVIQKCKCPWEFVPPASPPRTWVGLTDEEIDYYIVHRLRVATKNNLAALIRLCEAKLKEKNSA